MTEPTDPAGTPPERPLDVAVLLRAARYHADLSQRELAAVAGVSRGLVGDRVWSQAAPSWRVVVRLLAAAGCRSAARVTVISPGQARRRSRRRRAPAQSPSRLRRG